MRTKCARQKARTRNICRISHMSTWLDIKWIIYRIPHVWTWLDIEWIFFSSEVVLIVIFFPQNNRERIIFCSRIKTISSCVFVFFFLLFNTFCIMFLVRVLCISLLRVKGCPKTETSLKRGRLSLHFSQSLDLTVSNQSLPKSKAHMMVNIIIQETVFKIW